MYFTSDGKISFPSKYKVPLSGNQKFRKANSICKKLCSLVSDQRGYHFERKIMVLQKILDVWTEDGEVDVKNLTGNGKFTIAVNLRCE